MTEQEQKCNANSKRLTLSAIRRVVRMMKSRKYEVYTEPYKLNIVGFRNPNTNPLQFDDDLFVFWKNPSGIWKGRKYKITTDPSTAYLKNPYGNNAGTAIVAHGQYVNSHKLRTHTGYPALSQRRDICIYRDYDRDDTLFFDVNTIVCKSDMGINIHRAKVGDADDGQGNTKKIGLYSAGCQVFQNYYCFQEFLDMCRRQVSMYGDDGFTYTLFDLSLKRKFMIKRSVYGLLMGLGIYLLIPRGTQ